MGQNKMLVYLLTEESPSLALNVREISSQNMITCSVAQWTLDVTQMLLRRSIREGLWLLKEGTEDSKNVHKERLHG